MAGQIIERRKPEGKRPGTYLIRLELPRVNGKRKTLNHTVHGRKRDAETVLAELLLEKSRGRLVAPTRETLQQYAEKNWLPAAARRVSPRTLAGYTAALERYIFPDLGGVKLSSIGPWDVQRAYDKMTDRGLSARTVAHTHAVLNQLFKTAVRKRDLSSNPADVAELPKDTGRIKKEGLSGEQVSSFLDAAHDSPHKAVYHVLFTCGLRPGELFGLTWPDVDLAACELTVRQAVTYGPDRTVILSTPKTNQIRRVAFTPELASILSDHKERTSEIVNPQQLVFPTIDGGLQHPNHWSKADFKGLLAKAGLPIETRLYDTRHTMATLALQAKVPVHIVSARLGHASAKQTLDTYAHVIKGDQETAADALATLIYRRPTTETGDAPVN